jgi:shikimate kinase
MTASRRPALSGGDPLDEVADALAAREPLYREVADVAIDTATADATAVAEQILAWLGSESPEGAA